MQVVDQIGQELIFENTPKRIVCLVPSISELLAHYEPTIELVGVTRFCEFPKELRKVKTVVGGTKDPDFKTIKALNPNLVIANKEENNKEDIEQLQQVCPVYVSDVFSVESAIELVVQLETILDINIGYQIQNRLNELKNEISPKLNGTVAYVIWQNPIMIAGQGTFVNDWLERIGLVNITSNSRYPTITENELKQFAPEYIFLSSEPYPFKEKNLNEFTAHYKVSKVVLVDGRIFSWYGMAMLEANDYFLDLINKINGN